ncbi:MAG: hypothetical protein HYR49_10650 [Gammaproteobacteria bacterium]|nr:hypothetical protein [Gammaproteobacteria bacterium]
MIPKLIALLAICLFAGGCTSAGKYVYIASDTSLGVIGAMNTAQTSGKLIIGYDRDFIAVVPKKPASGNKATASAAGTNDLPPDRPGDALSAFNCTHVEIKGIKVTKFYERLATGPAAIALAAADLPTTAGKECSYDGTARNSK